MKIAHKLIVLVLLFCIASCNNSEKAKEVKQKVVTVYGSNECHHCTDFKKKLDSAKIVYTFHDVEIDALREKEMMGKIRAINYQGTGAYPVVEVGAQLFVNPDFSQVLGELGSSE